MDPIDSSSIWQKWVNQKWTLNLTKFTSIRVNDNFGANCLTIEGYLMQYYFLWDKFIIGTNQQVEWGGCPHWTWTSDETSTKLIPQPGRASPAAWKVEPHALCNGRHHHACWLSLRWTWIKFADKFCCCKHPGAWDSCWPTSFWAKVQNAFLALINCHEGFVLLIYSCWKCILCLLIALMKLVMKAFVLLIYNWSKCISMFEESRPFQDYHIY